METKLTELVETKDDMSKWLYSEMMKHEEKKHIRSFIIILLLVISLVGSNCYWIWYNSQWEYSTETVTMETSDDGVNAYNSGEGDLNIGEDDSEKEN